MLSSAARFFFLACLAIFSPIRDGQADGRGVGSSAADIVSESTPSAFAPNDFDTEDFTVEWIGDPPSDITAALTPRTLQWVRVSDVLVLPRGQLVLTSQKSLHGIIEHAGRVHSFLDTPTGAQADVTVALLPSAEPPVRISLENGQKAALRFRFTPRPVAVSPLASPLVAVDSTCSRAHIEIKGPTAPPFTHWTYVGCRLIHTSGAEHNTAALEISVYLADVETLKANGTVATPIAPGFWTFTVRSRGTIELDPGDKQRFTIDYAVPENDHRGFIGFGLGPYFYTIHGGGLDTDQPAPLATIYAGYRISETTRLTAFNATAIHPQYYTDFGIYLNTQSVRAIDNRLTMNLLLGGHLLGFQTANEIHVRPSIPQGVELNITDFLARAHNLTLGSFIYPPIDKKAYYNIWLRWGTARLFVELNYILWQDTTGSTANDEIYSRSLGISFGIPLFNFL